MDESSTRFLGLGARASALQALGRTLDSIDCLRTAVTLGYYKVDKALPAADLEPVRQTLCSTEPVELLRAARAIVRLYQQLAPPLAQAHGISYPAALAHQMQERLERLDTQWPRA